MIDEAIATCHRRQNRATLGRLIALGPEALRRVIDIYYGGAPFEQPAGHGLAGRELVDLWSTMLGVLARAHPDVFLDELDSGRVLLSESPTLELVILDGIAHPRATAVLRQYAEHADWLVRHHAQEGLRGRS